MNMTTQIIEELRELIATTVASDEIAFLTHEIPRRLLEILGTSGQDNEVGYGLCVNCLELLLSRYQELVESKRVENIAQESRDFFVQIAYKLFSQYKGFELYKDFKESYLRRVLVMFRNSLLIEGPFGTLECLFKDGECTDDPWILAFVVCTLRYYLEGVWNVGISAHSDEQGIPICSMSSMERVLPTLKSASRDIERYFQKPNSTGYGPHRPMSLVFKTQGLMYKEAISFTEDSRKRKGFMKRSNKFLRRKDRLLHPKPKGQVRRKMSKYGPHKTKKY